MSTALDSLSHEDRLVFEANLARFGLVGEQHASGALIIPEGATVTLHRDTQDSGRHFVFQTQDADQFKAWIGTPDAVFEEEEYELPLPIRNVPVGVPTTGLDSEHWIDLCHAARAYFWGPSYRVQSHKAAIETHLDLQTVVHVYTTLDVGGWVTFPDPSVTVIANTINYSDDGTIGGNTNITIYATNIYRRP